jgi:hypothetical protein
LATAEHVLSQLLRAGHLAQDTNGRYGKPLLIS